MESVKCDKCNQILEGGDWPFCPHPKSSTAYVNSDDIPGGIEIKHGICNPDGSPRRFYSKSEIRKAAFEAGLSISGETPKQNQKLNDKKWAEAVRKGRNWI